MRGFVYILAIFIASFVFRANDGFTCANTSSQTSESCHQSNKNKSCCNTKSTAVDNNCKGCGEACGGVCENSSRDCTHSLTVPFLNLSWPSFKARFNISQQNWNVNQTVPRHVYFAIWAPPKIK